jgi:hypothetical protein
VNAEDCDIHRYWIDQPGTDGIYYPWVCECPPRHPVDICEVHHMTREEEDACETLRRADVPACGNCIPQQIESHPTEDIIRCANCKEWLAW